METNPTKMQVFLRKKIFWKSFYHTGRIHSFSFAEGFGGIDLQKPEVSKGTFTAPEDGTYCVTGKCIKLKEGDAFSSSLHVKKGSGDVKN